MGKIIVEQIVSADGFAADKDRGIAFFEQDPDLHELDQDQLRMLETIDAFIIGANTYKMFVEFWPTEKSKDEPVSRWINSHPVHVVSNSLKTAPWGPYAPASIERGDAAQVVTAVGDHYRQDVIVWGSLKLTEALFRAKVVDRLRLRMMPRLIGAGISVAPPDLKQTELTLVASKVYPKGHVVLDYRIER